MEKMKLEITNIDNIGIIKNNIENVKQELISIVNHYQDLVYSEDDIKTAKEDRAMLNKISKYFNDERIDAEKRYMQPFNHTIKEPIAELVKLAKDTSLKIDVQVKEFEENERIEKHNLVVEIYKNLNTQYAFKYLNEQSYLLKGMNEEKILESMKQKINRFDEDIEILKTQNPVDLEDTKKFYFRNDCNVRLAIQEIQRINEIAKKVEEKTVENIVVNVDTKPVFTETKETIEEFTLTVFATPTQIKELKQFLKENNIRSL